MDSDRLFDLTRSIAGTGNKKAKLFYMVPEMKTLLFYTYNMDYTYGIKKVYTSGVGGRVFSKTTWDLLDVLRHRALTGGKAEDIVAKYVRSLTVKSGELFRMILNRSLDCGIGPAIINEKFPDLIPEHKVMLAQTFDPKRVEFPVFGSPKLDGVRAIYNRKALYTRKGKQILGCDDIIKELYLHQIKTRLDGELIIPNMSFQKSSGLIRSHSETPKAEFWVFDAPDIQEPFRSRMFILEGLISHLSRVKFVPNFNIVSHDRALEFYVDCRRQGFEGAMLKNPLHSYQAKRSWDWQKMKAVLSGDYPIVGTFEGEGKYEGKLGGIIVDVRGRKVRVGSGFSDGQRDAFFPSDGRIVGRLAEILFQEKTPDGSLRHPRFYRIRDDK